MPVDPEVFRDDVRGVVQERHGRTAGVFGAIVWIVGGVGLYMLGVAFWASVGIGLVAGVWACAWLLRTIERAEMRKLG